MDPSVASHPAEIETRNWLPAPLPLRYPSAMAGFFSTLLAEQGARRRRLRSSMGDRGQGIIEFLVLGGRVVGSLGLLIEPWMPGAAPWGFALPVVFAIGFLLIEARRQAAAKRAEAAVNDEERAGPNYDWLVLLWSLGCALAGAAAFVIAWSAQPAANHGDENWQPPAGTVPVDISPTSQ
jgi:hypothetical protein